MIILNDLFWTIIFPYSKCSKRPPLASMHFHTRTIKFFQDLSSISSVTEAAAVRIRSRRTFSFEERVRP